jgi:hypothetical protein
MHLDWAALGQVAVIGIGVAVAVVVIFSLGILALSHRDAEIDAANSGAVALTGALLCFTACAATVLYGIYLIIPALHH